MSETKGESKKQNKRNTGGKGRGTRAEYEMRTSRVARMLASSVVRSEIIEYCQREWGVGRGSADNYIRDARAILKEDWDIDRQQMVAELLSQVQSIQKEARKQQNMAVALGCVNAAARITQIIS